MYVDVSIRNLRSLSHVHRAATATAPLFFPNLLPNTETIVLDALTCTFHSSLIPTPNHWKNDHLIYVNATALYGSKLAWPFQYPKVIYTEVPARLATPACSPFHPGDGIFDRTLPNRLCNFRHCIIVRNTEMALRL